MYVPELCVLCYCQRQRVVFVSDIMERKRMATKRPLTTAQTIKNSKTDRPDMKTERPRREVRALLLIRLRFESRYGHL